MGNFKSTLITILLLGCGHEKVNNRSHVDTELEKLKKQIIELQGTVAQINSFVASDFSNCSASLPAFESKICQIAQTATAEQQVIFTGQLQKVVKIFQNEIYGEDCIDDTSPGCPVAGSILADIADIDVSGLEADIAQLQADVLQLQADLAGISSRLDDFNGSGTSIEAVIAGIDSDLLDLENRIETLEEAINQGDIYHTYLLCEDIADSGPAYEPILVTGDNTLIVAYMEGSSKNGMGVVAEAGITGTQYLETDSNTKKCNFAVYDLTSSLKVCWNNANRNANNSSIDNVCDSANNFTSPTGDCTCVN